MEKKLQITLTAARVNAGYSLGIDAANTTNNSKGNV